MSWAEDHTHGCGRRRRRRLPAMLVAGAAVLGGPAACVFHPVYAPPASERAVFDANIAAISVDPIPDRIGQLLANALRDSFNPGSMSVGKQYGLTIVLTTS